MIYNWHYRIVDQARGVLPCGGWDRHGATTFQMASKYLSNVATPQRKRLKDNPQFKSKITSGNRKQRYLVRHVLKTNLLRGDAE